jgi:predicted HD superfamily hydrolase involved in NAD metabolism
MEHTKYNFHILRAEEYIALIEERLSRQTVSHGLSVAQYMASLSELLEIPYESAVTAGLLHDLEKETPKEHLLRKAEDYGLPISPSQWQNPKLLHGPVAAEECRRELGLNDDAVYEAIYWHTTGRPELGLTGLALYFADYAEPLRKRPEATHAREMCDKDGFYRALYFVASQKVQYVRTRAHVDPISEEFFEWIGRELVRQGHLSEQERTMGISIRHDG